MIISKAYDVEILPNFFSIVIIDLQDYLTKFADSCIIDNKGKRKPIPLIQKYTVAEIKEKLATVKKKSYYITDKDDSQLIPMLGALNDMRMHYDHRNIPVRTDMFGYNSMNYDRLMVAALLMFHNQVNSTKELITKLYETSKKIIETQDDKDASYKDYYLTSLRNYRLPYIDIDVMCIFALNKAGTYTDKDGNKKYIPKSLKQTSINLQWYELLEHELPPIEDGVDYEFYSKNPKYKGLPPEVLNNTINKWDRYIIDEWIPPTMHYNENDVFIVCEIVRLYIDEVRLRYSISNVYQVDVLNSSRSNIADKLFTKFYSEFSGLHPSQWTGRKTERTALAFKRVIVPSIKFKTKYLQDILEEMKQVVIYSVNKDSFTKEIKLGNLIYTVATGGLHTQDIPRELKSKIILDNDISTGDSPECNGGDFSWNKLTPDSYVYIHWDIASFYPSLIVNFNVAPKHLNEGVFVKLIRWLRDTRVAAKHTEGDIDGIPSKVLAEVLKIVINSIYGKLGFEKGDLCDRLAVLKVTINGQLLIMMLCEELELNNIEVISANTDGIVIKLYAKDKEKFEEIAENWKQITGFEADSEEYDCYINRDINNYIVRELNGKLTYKGALNPKMYAVDLQKGYDMPIVAQAVANYFLEGKPIMESLYECKNILDFCKTQNVGRKFNVEFCKGKETIELQRNVRYFVSNEGGTIYKVNKTENIKNNLCAGQKVTVLNSLDDVRIEYRNICYSYYYNECLKIIDPIKLSISPKKKGDRKAGTLSGKRLIDRYSGMYNTLFDDNDEEL